MRIRRPRVVLVAVAGILLLGLSPTLIAAPSSQAGVTIANTGFEVDTAGYKTNSGTTLSRATTPVHSGVGAAALRRVSSTGYATLINPFSSISGGSPCTASAWVLGPSGTKLTIKWRPYRDRTELTSQSKTLLMNGAWQRTPVNSFTTPTGTNLLNLEIFISLQAGKSWYADDVFGSCGANRAPVAALTVTPAEGQAPLAVTIDAGGSSDPDGDVLSYAFNFGDGTAVGSQAAATARHTFASVGTCDVTVTATDPAGQSNTATKSVRVVAAPVNQPPVAALTVSPSSGVAPLSITAASASTDPEGGVLSYSFDFGEGSVVGPQAAATATHTYASTGSYRVTLTVTDPQGLVSTASEAVAVNNASPPPSADPVIVGAGDIAAGAAGTSAYVTAQSTANQIRAVINQNPDTTVFTLGDNAYGSGSASDYSNKYDPTWGVFRSTTRPIPGNHDYDTAGATGYFGYFFGGSSSGNEYYAYDLGSYWRAYALNCEIPCGAGSIQEQWLKADLAAHPGRHYFAQVHEPRYTSGSDHGDYTTFSAMWTDLQAAGGEFVLAGHNHGYERFAEMNSAGKLDAQGMRQFVAGMGGRTLYPFVAAPDFGSQTQDATHFGVLKVVLHLDSYEWQFIGSGRCQTGYDTAATIYDCPEVKGTVLDTGTEPTKPLPGSSN